MGIYDAMVWEWSFKWVHFIVGQTTERRRYEINTWLIENCQTTKVKIGYLEIDCLIYTESQVSILSEELVKSLDLDISTYPVLELKTANGLKVINNIIYI